MTLHTNAGPFNCIMTSDRDQTTVSKRAIGSTAALARGLFFGAIFLGMTVVNVRIVDPNILVQRAAKDPC